MSFDTTRFFDRVIESITQLGSFSTREAEIFVSKLTARNICKDDFILKEREICQSFNFIIHGSLRHYLILQDGTELTLNLFSENDWVVDYQSFTSQKPTENYIRHLKKRNCLN